jgi:c-di-GMP-binding flagellar brake protein YcgR
MTTVSLKQREHYRVSLESQVTVETGDGHFLKGTCVNISMGGMCLLLEEKITKKLVGRVRMTFEFYGEINEFCAGFSVVWTGAERPNVPLKQAGIQFSAIDFENRSSLTRIIIARLSELENNRSVVSFEPHQYEHK